jgi:hypothetical protein
MISSRAVAVFVLALTLALGACSGSSVETSTGEAAAEAHYIDAMRKLGLVTNEDDERAAVETGTKLCGYLDEGSLNPQGYVDSMATRGYGEDLSRPVLDGAIEAFCPDYTPPESDTSVTPATGLDVTWPPPPVAGPVEPTEGLDPQQCFDDAFYLEHEQFCATLTPEQSASEGSVADPATAFHVYPQNGLRVDLMEVRVEPETFDIGFEDDTNSHDRAVYVTVKLTNTGSDAIPLADEFDIRSMLYYGENQYEGNEWVLNSADRSLDDLPQQLVPGSSAEGTELYSIESSGEDVLRYTFNPDTASYSDHTFTDVESMVQG